jgi:hypothetical protein
LALVIYHESVYNYAMPTPFTHLQITQKLLTDTSLPEATRTQIQAYLPAFQLGSIVADARVASGIGREVTHFYSYDTPITDHPWRVMLKAHPTLQQSQSEAHRMFIAGYVAHLATDEAWALKMVRPNFAERDWVEVNRVHKFIALHLLLTHMDERDETKLEQWQADTLPQCQPQQWLPFIPDDVIIGWRDLIYHQIKPDGLSKTLDIFSQRLCVEPLFLRDILDDPDTMTRWLWAYVDPEEFATAEALMYNFTCDQLQIYLTEF